MPPTSEDLRTVLGLVPGQPVDLAAIDPRSTPGLPHGRGKVDPKVWSRDEVTRLGVRLAEYQEMLFGQAKAGGDRRRVLLVLQAMDCGGKDGTVKNVAGAMNPQGLHIVGFGAPTEEERRHDFLWRIRRALPGSGIVGVFNRSHYEDVLIARVRSLVAPDVWAGRYDEINRFEAELVADDITLVKVMLHISYEEQGRRLQDRLADPTKRWKYNPADVDERQLWDDYQVAYADALQRCGTAAPWYVVPADRKWYRNWAVAHILQATMADLRLSYPEPSYDVARERERVAATVRTAVPQANIR